MTDYTKLIERLNEYKDYIPAAAESAQAIEALTLRAGEGYSAKIEALIAERDQLQAKLDAMGKGAPDGNALLQAIARGWCSEKNSGKVMDALLALAIRDEVQKLYAAPKALAPLTRKQISDLDEEGVFLGNIYEITKEIEAAHGIGGTP